MIKAAEKASKSVIRDFGEVEKLQVSKKGPRDFVTKTDKHVEKILIEELSKTKKNYSFLSEEVGSIENKDKDNIWIIDPIDGTTNFLHGIPHFAICVALESKKEIISGLIFDPIKDEIFFFHLLRYPIHQLFFDICEFQICQRGLLHLHKEHIFF